MKKTLSLALVVLMIMSAFAVFAISASADDAWDWNLKDGVLTITGTGATDDYRDKESERPWADKLGEITKVVVEDGITYVGSSSFTHCEAMTEISFGKNVSSFGQDAFSYCDALTTVVFNGKIESIAQGICYSSNAITKVTITGQTKEEFLAVAHEKPYNTAWDNAEFTVQNGTTPDPVDPEPPVEDKWTWEVKDGVLTISGTGKMDDYRNVESTRPWIDSIDSITKVVVGDGITYVGSSAFTGMKAVTEITFGKKAAAFGQDAFSNCPALTTVVFNCKVESIGQGICYNSKAITSVTITDQTFEEFKAIATKTKYNFKDNGDIEVGFDLAKFTVQSSGNVSAGETTVVIVVLSMVALFGTALVVSKKVLVK